VFDEADEMAEMGFQEDVERILADTPEYKQVALFSATRYRTTKRSTRSPASARSRPATSTYQQRWHQRSTLQRRPPSSLQRDDCRQVTVEPPGDESRVRPTRPTGSSMGHLLVAGQSRPKPIWLHAAANRGRSPGCAKGRLSIGCGGKLSALAV